MVSKLLLATAAAVLATAPAHAIELTCSAPTILVGKQSKDAHDTVVGIDVSYEDGEWMVRHRMGNSSEVHRESQYDLKDNSGNNLTQWRGVLKRNTNEKMIGEIKQDKNGNLYYVEWYYYRGDLRFNTMSKCRDADDALRPVPARKEPEPAKEWPRWLKQ